MGIIKKIRGAARSKANAALDRAIDPTQQIEMLILDLETQYRRAMKDLIGYKADAKVMEHSIAEQQTRALAWEKRAMIAIKQGEDETAKECLSRKRQCEQEIRKISGDQAEAASYASQLNTSRKKLDGKLRMLKLKKGTLAGQLAVTRSAVADPLANNKLFEKLEEAERRIDAKIFEQEAAAELDEETGADLTLEAELLKLDQSDTGAPLGTDGPESDPLALLKAKMKSDPKRLKE